MKKLVLFLLLLVPLYASGQQYVYPYDEPKPTKVKVDWGGIKIPNNSVFCVQIDIKGARLGGMTYDERIEIDPEIVTDWNDEVQRCVDGANRYFVQWAGSRATTLKFTAREKGAEYMIKFKVRSVTEKGYIVADVTIEAPDGKIATISNLKAKGGIYGTFTNLMGDGLESLGCELAKLLNKEMNFRVI